MNGNRLSYLAIVFGLASVLGATRPAHALSLTIQKAEVEVSVGFGGLSSSRLAVLNNGKPIKLDLNNRVLLESEEGPASVLYRGELPLMAEFNDLDLDLKVKLEMRAVYESDGVNPESAQLSAYVIHGEGEFPRIYPAFSFQVKSIEQLREVQEISGNIESELTFTKTVLGGIFKGKQVNVSSPVVRLFVAKSDLTE